MISQTAHRLGMALLLLVVLLGPGAFAAGNGDLNGDGIANTIDVGLVRDYLIGKINLSPAQSAAADINGDGKIDVADTVASTNRFVKKITIDATPDTASWTLTGPAGFTTINGLGDRIGTAAISGAPAGSYKLHCNAVAGLLPPADITATFATNGTLVFTPTYCGVSSIAVNPVRPSNINMLGTVSTSGTLTGTGSGTIEYHWITQKPNYALADSGPLTVSMVNGVAVVPAYAGFPTDAQGTYQAYIKVTKPATIQSAKVAYTVDPPASVSSITLNQPDPFTVAPNGRITFSGQINGAGTGPIEYRWVTYISNDAVYSVSPTMTVQMVHGVAAVPAFSDLPTALPYYYNIYIQVVSPITKISPVSYYGVLNVSSISPRAFTFPYVGQNGSITNANTKVNGSGYGYIEYHWITQKPDGVTVDSGPLKTLFSGSIPSYSGFPTDLLGDYHAHVHITYPVTMDSSAISYTVELPLSVNSIAIAPIKPSPVQYGGVVSTSATLTGTGSGTVEYHWITPKGSPWQKQDLGPYTVTMLHGKASIPVFKGLPTQGSGANATFIRVTSQSPVFESAATTYTVRSMFGINKLLISDTTPSLIIAPNSKITYTGAVVAYGDGEGTATYSWEIQKPNGATVSSADLKVWVTDGYAAIPAYSDFPTSDPGVYSLYLYSCNGPTIDYADYSATRLYCVSPPTTSTTAAVNPFRHGSCVQATSIATSGTVTGEGNGYIEYHWITQKDGVAQPIDSGPLFAQMINGRAVIPTYTQFPTMAPGDYQTFIRVTHQTPSIDSPAAHYTVTVDPELKPELLNVPAGTFTMGRTDSGDDAAAAQADELPRHLVTLSAYQIGKHEITFGQFASMLNWAYQRGLLSADGPYGSEYVYFLNQPIWLAGQTSGGEMTMSFINGKFAPATRTGAANATYNMKNFPASAVTWYGAVAYCNWLSESEGLTPCYDLATWTLKNPAGNGYRLPTEAEWERAAAWDGSKHWIYGYTGDTVTDFSRMNAGSQSYVSANPMGFFYQPYSSPVGWFNGLNISPYGHVQTVNSVSPVGCYDMSGNAAEWCHDYYAAYTADPQTNPTGPVTGMHRVVRGGSYSIIWPSCRTATRLHYSPTEPTLYSSNGSIGFRIVRSQ